MNVLIVGLGSIAKKHIIVLKKLSPHSIIYALRSGIKNPTEVGVVNIKNFGELSMEEIGFVIISTPTFLHKQNIFELLKLKKPLFIEKPLANTLNLNSIISKISNSNTSTYIACNLRFLDSLNYVKSNYINKNFRINEVNIYCGSYLPDWRPASDFRKSYSSDEKKGGGVHLDLIHEIDYAYWFFGKPLSQTRVLNRKSSLKIKSVDYANYVLEYKKFSVSIILNYFRKDPKRTLELVTDKGTILVDLLKNEVKENGNTVYKSSQGVIDTYEDQMRYYLSNFKKRNRFNNINEAFEVLKICLK